ncbi:hypothetical protein BY996DRAFT_4583455 [Phakopsora pachyrhizi]|nr:hypothetical protein BY996DRAFT_4583455 [Phakopsora pachyrhizi]
MFSRIVIRRLSDLIDRHRGSGSSDFSTNSNRLEPFLQSNRYSPSLRSKPTQTKQQQQQPNGLRDDSNNPIGLSFLIRAGFLRQSSAGIWTFLSNGLRVLNKVQNITRDEMERIGASEVSMPLLQTASLWEKSRRLNSVGRELFQLNDRRGSKYVLSPTHEEEVTQLVKTDLNSIKQVPIRLFHIGRKFRDEIRPRAGLLRSKEFMMKDLYTFDQDLDSASRTYSEVQNSFERILKRIGIPFTVAEADSGSIGGAKSHEYHFKSIIGEDTLINCTQCDYTANLELAQSSLSPTITDFTESCIRCGADLESSQAIEVGHTFLLGTKYSTAFGLNLDVPDPETKAQNVRPVEMGCYGIGTSRLVGAIAECSHDERGLRWPVAVAPFKACIIIPSPGPENDQRRVAGRLGRILESNLPELSNDVLIDDRSQRIGWKLMDADLVGYPVVVVIGKRWIKESMIEIRKRNSNETHDVEAIFLSSDDQGEGCDGRIEDSKKKFLEKFKTVYESI